MTEREAWDAQAPDYAHAQLAVWAEAGTDYERRALDCLAVLWPRLGLDASSAGHVLDLGCGVGRIAYPLAGALPGCRVVGVDVSPRMLDLAAGLAGMLDLPAVDFRLGDGRTLPPVAPLAGAYSMLVFQHIPRLAAASYVHQVAERMLPGARFVFQYVEGDGDSGMSVETPEEMVRAWCGAAGLVVEAVDHGLMYDNWGWVTCSS